MEIIVKKKEPEPELCYGCLRPIPECVCPPAGPAAWILVLLGALAIVVGAVVAWVWMQ